MGFTPQYCSVCGKELRVVSAGIYGGTVAEHSLMCPTNDCYTEEYYQGMYQVCIGARDMFEWGGDFLKPTARMEEVIERIREERQIVLDTRLQERGEVNG